MEKTDGQAAKHSAYADSRCPSHILDHLGHTQHQVDRLLHLRPFLCSSNSRMAPSSSPTRPVGTSQGKRPLGNCNHCSLWENSTFGILLDKKRMRLTTEVRNSVEGSPRLLLQLTAGQKPYTCAPDNKWNRRYLYIWRLKSPNVLFQENASKTL